MEVWSKGLFFLLSVVSCWASCPDTCPCAVQPCEFVSTEYVLCPARFTTLPGVGAVDVGDCVCMPGFRGSMQTDCVPCAGDEYCPLNSVEPVICPVGYRCNASTAEPLPGNWDANHTDFQLCPAGFTCSRDGTSPPVVCAPGSYCPEGMDYSLPCPSGTYCGVGSSLPQTCPEAFFCGENASVLMQCSAGSYCPAGSATPISCPAASMCPAGVADPIACSAGSYCLEGVSESTRCPPGFYCAAGSSRPVMCSGGRLCLEGSSGNTEPCPGGMTCVGGNIITQCSAGEYCVEGSSAGVTCPDGFFCSAGLSAPISCDRGIICPAGSVDDRTPCPPGMHCVNGKAYPCPASLYCPLGSYAGVPCPAAEYCPAGSASPLSCPAARYCPAGVSEPMHCTAGSYCPTNSPAPIICPAHFYCPAGSSAPIACPHGRICLQGSFGIDQLCPDGLVCDGGSVVGPCPATNYCQGGNQTACLDGEICLEGSSTPFICQAGTYCPAGSLEAQGCPEDYYCAERVGMFAPCPDGAICPATTVEPCFGVPARSENLTRFCGWNCSSGYTVNADATDCIAQNGTSFATVLDYGTGNVTVDRLFLKNLTGQVEIQGGCGVTTECKAMVMSILRRDGTMVYCDRGHCPGYDEDGNELPNTTETASVRFTSTTDVADDVSTSADELDFTTAPDAFDFNTVSTTGRDTNSSGRRLLQAGGFTPVPSINPRVTVALISVTPVSVNITFSVRIGNDIMTCTISFNVPVNNTAFGDTKALILRIMELLLAPPPQPTAPPVVYPITAEQVATLTTSAVVAVACVVVAVALCFYVVCKKDIYWCCGVMCIKCCGPGKKPPDVEKGKLPRSDSTNTNAGSVLDSISDGTVDPANLVRTKMTWPRIDTRNHIKIV